MASVPTSPASIALVTGASGGIGRAVARRLSARGLVVVAVSRDLARLHAALPPIAAGEPGWHAVQADVSTPEGAAAALAGCIAAAGVPGVLVHAAGSTLITAAHRTTAEQWRQVLAANLDSAFFTLSRWVESLREAQQPGAAVLFSSVVSRIGVANHEAIAAAKGGVEALARSMAATYAPQGIRCNVVAPGMTETPMTAGLLRSDAVREAAAKQYPLGGIGAADEVAALADWLVSDASARVTGQVVAVDGGFTAVRPLVR